MRLSIIICLILISSGTLLCQPYQNEVECFLDWRTKELNKLHCNTAEKITFNSDLLDWADDPFFLQNFLIDSASDKTDTLRFMQRIHLANYRELRKSINNEYNSFFIQQLDKPMSSLLGKTIKCEGDHVSKNIFFSQPIFNKNFDLVFVIERIADTEGLGSITTIKSYKKSTLVWEEHISFGGKIVAF
ncbi:MAG: hypothetical protein GY816_02875 [Cytophagales bacterium]|nr:hypothetical protein [Cytophagales bacterium]